MAAWDLYFIVVCLDCTSVVSSLLSLSLSPRRSGSKHVGFLNERYVRLRYAFSLACVIPCQSTPLTFLPPVCARTGSCSSGLMFQVDRCSPSRIISGSLVFISPPFYFLFFFWVRVRVRDFATCERSLNVLCWFISVAKRVCNNCYYS